MLKHISLALLTPIMLWLAWPEGGFTPLLFIAFVPLLLLERDIFIHKKRRSGLRTFTFVFLSVGLWNLLSIFWLFNAHWSGVVAAIIINGGCAGLVFLIFRRIKKKLGNQRAYIALPFLWICFETLHNYWDFSFPWLTLGNGFAGRVEWIQWYEWTGVFGGSIWVWVTNLLFFWIISAFLDHKEWKPFIGQSITTITLTILLPILISHSTYNNYKEKGEFTEIVVAQPNFNTYTEKFLIGDKVQLQKFIELAKEKLDPDVDFLVGPETLLPDGMDEDILPYIMNMQSLKKLTDSFPNLNIVVGASTIKLFDESQKSITAKPSRFPGKFFEKYNSALLINEHDSIGVYHKSKLVAGVEMMPLIRVLKPLLGELVQDMGGTSGSLAIQDERENFKAFNKNLVAAPVICWESDFGEYTGEYVRKGANLIFVITNDDWWGNTQGHKQHLHYSRLRAIENRRSIARSANTGISCFINQRGDILNPLYYRKTGVIKETLQANTELTYYTKSGDVISRLSLFMSSFFLLFTLVKGHLQKRQALPSNE